MSASKSARALGMSNLARLLLNLRIGPGILSSLLLWRASTSVGCFAASSLMSYEFDWLCTLASGISLSFRLTERSSPLYGVAFSLASLIWIWLSCSLRWKRSFCSGFVLTSPVIIIYDLLNSQALTEKTGLKFEAIAWGVPRSFLRTILFVSTREISLLEFLFLTGEL